MDLNVIEKVLYACSDVHNVKVVDMTIFREEEYQKIIECDLSVAKQVVPIVVAVPQNWQRTLIDIYIAQNMTFPFIPHVDIKGKFCLFETEGVLIDQNLGGIILQSIEKAKEIIEDGLARTNREDFIEEFESYWLQLPSIRLAKVDVVGIQHIGVVKYFTKTAKRYKKESYAKYMQRAKSGKIYVSQDPQKLKHYYKENESVNIRNGVYINIEVEDFLFPPDARYIDINEYFQNILRYVDVKEFQAISSKISSDKLIIFAIKQPNGVSTVLGFLLEKCMISFENAVCRLRSVSQITPILIDRIDKQYLMTRSNEVSNILADKKVLLIGCGSLGGYIANELVKAGIEKMMLLDADHLYENNVFRHLLGLEYVGQYKCVALQNYFEKNIPDLKISSLAEKIEEAVQEGNIEFGEYDLIISATGDHNVNRWINQYVMSNKLMVPVVYAWNEVLGVGNHVAYIEYGNVGCYECFIGRDEDTGELYDRTAYCRSGQKVVQKVAGCGSSFIPYGSTISLKTAGMCVDTIKKIFEGRYSDNIIISAKGDDYHFKRDGLQVSNKYLNQKDSIVECNGKLFAQPRCKFCGEKYGD